MFIKTSDGTEVIIAWSHDPKGTRCGIFHVTPDSKKGEEIAFGKTYRNPIDTHNKERGRKLSLSRALLAAYPQNKAVRRYVWDTYLRRKELAVISDGKD